MIRKKKKYNRPRKAYESKRIQEEIVLVQKYGLKNKREIWKASANVNYYRTRAKVLAKASMEEQKILFNKLNAIGLKVSNIADVLDLKVENLLERRLPTVLFARKMAATPRQARQLVVHKKVLVDGNVVNSPSYLVPSALEKQISLRVSVKKSPAKHEQNTNSESQEQKEAKQ